MTECFLIHKFDRERLKATVPKPLMSPLKNVRAIALGRFSRSIAEVHLRARALRPRSYHQKVLHVMAFDRDPIRSIFADKIAVRDYVASVVGDEYLTKAYSVGHQPSQIPWIALPRNYVAKANHGSGGMVVVSEEAPLDMRVPDNPTSHDWGHVLVHPDHADVARIIRLFERWLTLDFSWYFGKRFPEWAYGNISPGILVEERLAPKPGEDFHDVRVHVVDGRVVMIRHRARTDDGRRHSVTYDGDWKELPVTTRHASEVAKLPHQPLSRALQEEVTRVALALSRPVDLVRVDLYVVGRRLTFGELTNYPSAGGRLISPRSMDRRILRDTAPTNRH